MSHLHGAPQDLSTPQHSPGQTGIRAALYHTTPSWDGTPPREMHTEVCPACRRPWPSYLEAKFVGSMPAYAVKRALPTVGCLLKPQEATGFQEQSQSSLASGHLSTHAVSLQGAESEWLTLVRNYNSQVYQSLR